MMMSNGGGGGGGGGDGKGNVNGNGNGGGRKRDHQQVEDEEGEEDHEALVKEFPIGYRFKPTDEELVKYYLRPKVNKLQLPLNLIKDVNIYEFHPSQFSGRYRSYEDNEFYFFTPRQRKYQEGVRPDRAANGGYWKASGSDDPIRDTKTNEKIGYKRSLAFYHGNPPKSDAKKAENLRESKSEWLMHEYTLEKLRDQQKAKRRQSKQSTYAGSSNHKQLNEFILCKLYKKPDKSKKDIKYPHRPVQCEDKVVDVAPPSSIGNATSSAAAVVEDHQIHQNVVVAAAAAGDQQYPVPSMVAATTAEGMVQQHYMWQSEVDDMGMMPLNYNCNYLDNGNLSFSSIPSAAILPSVDQYYYGEMDQQQLQLEILPSVNQHYYGEMDPHQLQPAGPSVNHNYNGEMNQHQLQPAAVLPSVYQHTNSQMNQQLDEVFEMLMADLKNTGIQTNMGFFSPPGVRTDIGPR